MSGVTLPKGASKESVLAAALALPPSDREEVAEHIMASLDGNDASELSADQLAMLQRRVAEVKEGKVQSIPAPDALRMAKEREVKEGKVQSIPAPDALRMAKERLKP